MTQRRIALFGGSFDPIHLGHTRVADAARRAIDAEKVIFVPARVSPLKGFFPFASDKDRLNMIALAIADNDACAVSDCELTRPAPSYTLQSASGLALPVAWSPLWQGSLSNLVQSILVLPTNAARFYRATAP